MDMSMNKKHYGQVIKGKFVPVDPASFKLDFAKREGKTVYVTITERQHQRTLDQNSYFHGVIIPLISDETGMDTHEVKEALKWKFLRKEVGGIETVRPTAALTKQEFSKFVDEITRWAGEFLGLYIPPPNSVEL